MQTIPFGINIVDEKGNILYLSEGMKEQFGKDVTDKKCWELFRDDLQQCSDCPLHKGIKIGITETCESSGVLGGKVFQISHTGMIFNGKKALLEVFQDITESKQTEDKLYSTLKNLELSNKDLEQFAYVANHDLQEPLRMISSYTQLLERKYKDKLDPDANEYIHFAVDGAIRMQKLLNDLLEYSKISKSEKTFEKVDTSTVFGQVISNLQLLITSNRALITIDDLPVVKANESQMLSLFQNLIENAIKFQKKTELPKIHISCTKQNEMYRFSVADNGIGIEKQYHDRIFIVFQRLHSLKDYPGTGIGLSICKRIVERHGGSIWFESVLNEGTTFYFTLPA